MVPADEELLRSGLLFVKSDNDRLKRQVEMAEARLADKMVEDRST